MITTNTVPVIIDNTVVVAATHPDVKKGHPNEDGWFLSDFYAFNYLLKGKGASQVWLTAADPHKLITVDPDTNQYLHGNPFQTRKVVLSEELLNNNELTPVTIVETTEMIDRFLNEVREASRMAKRTNALLLLLVFCHGLRPYTFLLDNGQTSKGLTLARLKEAIEPGCRVTLVSTACYSGGWIAEDLSNDAHTPLNTTMLAAADGDNESNAWQVSRSIVRSCGSVFAGSLIETLTSTSTLLQDQLDDTNTVSTLQADSLQPEDPNCIQTQSYNAFCQSILDTCINRAHRLWYEQKFTFSAHDDAWEYSWTRRTGIPLAYFEARWEALRIVPYTGDANVKLAMDPNPSNKSFLGEAGPSRTGGINQDEVLHAMTANICQKRIIAMAELFLQTCPGDWDKGWGPRVRGILTDAIQGRTPTYDSDDSCDEDNKDDDVPAIIQFRWEAGLLADQIIQHFKLPVPSNKMCIMWDQLAWKADARARIPSMDLKYGHIWDRFRRDFGVEPYRSQGPPFTRFNYYIVAAVVEANLSKEATEDLVVKMKQLMRIIKGFYAQKIVQEPEVGKRGRNWMLSIGRRVRVTM